MAQTCSAVTIGLEGTSRRIGEDVNLCRQSVSGAPRRLILCPHFRSPIAVAVERWCRRARGAACSDLPWTRLTPYPAHRHGTGHRKGGSSSTSRIGPADAASALPIAAFEKTRSQKSGYPDHDDVNPMPGHVAVTQLLGTGLRSARTAWSHHPPRFGTLNVDQTPTPLGDPGHSRGRLRRRSLKGERQQAGSIPTGAGIGGRDGNDVPNLFEHLIERKDDDIFQPMAEQLEAPSLLSGGVLRTEIAD